MVYRPHESKWDSKLGRLVPVKQGNGKTNSKPKPKYNSAAVKEPVKQAPKKEPVIPKREVNRAPPKAAGVPWGYEEVNGRLVFKGKNAKPPAKQPVEIPRKQPTAALEAQIDRLRQQGYVIPDAAYVEKVFNDGTWVDNRGLAHEPEGRYGPNKKRQEEQAEKFRAPEPAPERAPKEYKPKEQPKGFEPVGAKTANGKPIDMSVLIEINDALKTLAKYGLTLAKKER